MAHKTQLTVPAVLENLQSLAALVMAAAGKAGFPESRIHSLDLVMEEALVNVFKYAYPDGGGEVTVTCHSTDEGTLTIRIEDTGKPFDPLSKPPPDMGSAMADRPVGGWGIHLIRKIMDDVRYSREGGRNILVLVAHRNPPRKA